MQYKRDRTSLFCKANRWLAVACNSDALANLLVTLEGGPLLKGSKVIACRHHVKWIRNSVLWTKNADTEGGSGGDGGGGRAPMWGTPVGWMPLRTRSRDRDMVERETFTGCDLEFLDIKKESVESARGVAIAPNKGGKHGRRAAARSNFMQSRP